MEKSVLEEARRGLGTLVKWFNWWLITFIYFVWESITEPTYLLTFSLLKSNLLVKVDVLPQLVEKKIRRYSSNQSDELSFTNKRLSFSIKSFQINFYSFTKKYVKNVHPVYGAMNLTHDLRDMSLLPLPLDQGSHPIVEIFRTK